VRIKPQTSTRFERARFSSDAARGIPVVIQPLFRRCDGVPVASGGSAIIEIEMQK
jgi:hypothetical protein